MTSMPSLSALPGSLATTPIHAGGDASLGMFLPPADELAATERSVRDPRDPTLTFTPNVLAADGFKRNRLTRRYVDDETERDYLAFAARDRWARVPLGLLFFPLVCMHSRANYTLEPHTTRGHLTIVVLAVGNAYAILGAILSSAAVVDRLPCRPLRRLLCRDVRALWASTLLAPTVLLQAADRSLFLVDYNRYARLLKPSPGVEVRVDPPTEIIGPIVYLVFLRARMVLYVPVSVVAFATLLTDNLIRFFNSTDDDVAWFATLFSVYVLSGLIVFAWEEQHRAHFRARATAAWQAARGAKLVELIAGVCSAACAPSEPSPSAGSDDAMSTGHDSAAANMGRWRGTDGDDIDIELRPFESLLAGESADRCVFVLAFRCHFKPFATAEHMLDCKAALVATIARAYRALDLAAVDVFGGCGDSVLLATDGVRKRDDNDERSMVAVTVCILARLVAAEFRNVSCCSTGDEGGSLVDEDITDVSVGSVSVRTGGDVDDAVQHSNLILPAACRARVLSEAAPRGTVVVACDDAADAVERSFDVAPVGDSRTVVVVGLPRQADTEAAAETASDIVAGRRSLGGEVALRRRTPADPSLAVNAARFADARCVITGLRGGQGASEGAKLVMADRAVSAKHVWRVLGGLTFEDDEVEARYRAQENAGPARHVVVFASAWFTALAAAMYACRGPGKAGAAVWACVAAAVLVTALMWAVLRPARPGQLRWALATVVLFPLQSAALVAALHFHPDATNPAKLHQYWLTFFVAHVFVYMIPTAVPFVVALPLIAAPYAATISWASHMHVANVRKEYEAKYFSPLWIVVAVVFYCVLVNAVRIRARLAFADHVTSQRSAGRWARARRELQRRLAAVVPAAVAERAVLQLTARIGKAHRGVSYSAIDEALVAGDRADNDGATLLHADNDAAEDAGRSLADEESDGAVDHGGATDVNVAASSTDPTRLSVKRAVVLLLDVAEAHAETPIAACAVHRTADAVDTAGSSEGELPRGSMTLSDNATLLPGINDEEDDFPTARTLGDSSDPPAPATLPARLRGAIDPLPDADPADLETSEADAAANEGDRIQEAVLRCMHADAHAAIAAMLRSHPLTAPGSAAGFFVTPHGPAGWLVVAGVGRTLLAHRPPIEQLAEVARAAAQLPAVERFGGLRSGLGRGAIAGDFVQFTISADPSASLQRTAAAATTSSTRLMYELVGPAIVAAVGDLRGGVHHLGAERAV